MDCLEANAVFSIVLHILHRLLHSSAGESYTGLVEYRVYINLYSAFGTNCIKSA